MLTYKDLQDQVLRHIDEASDTTTTLALVKDQLNRSHRRLLTARTWPFMLWPREESFTTVANVRAYALHPACGKLLSLWDSTERRYFPTIARRNWESVGVDRSLTNLYPAGYTFGTVWPVAAQPASHTLSLTSSSSSDTTVTVVIRGINTSDALVSETITMNGLTAAASTQTYTNILNVSKTGTWVGTLTITDGTTTLLTLLYNEYGKAYPTIEFTESPQVGLPFLYTFQRLPQNLVNDYDIPDTWPNDLAEIHVYDALLDMSTYNTDLGQKEQGAWKSRYDTLYTQLVAASDENIAGSYPRFVRDLNGGGLWRTNLVS